MDSALFEFLAFIPIAVMLAIGSYKVGRKRERTANIPRHSIAPHPTPAADHTHNWSPSPYLHDPGSNSYLYACLYTHCTEVLRSTEGPTK